MIRITSLCENTSCAPAIEHAHGLSLHIETPSRRILFDLGPDARFLRNASRLGIEIAAVDTVILSHGHNDHTGGLAALRKVCGAPVYARREALTPFYTKAGPLSVNIGCPVRDPDVFTFSRDETPLGDGLTLFSGVTGRKLFSRSNAALFKKENRALLPDTFDHEQNLLIEDEDGDVLITGCAHNGIVNILDRYAEIRPNGRLKAVVGGFHLFNPVARRYEPRETIEAIADRLKDLDAVFYTCHCTGPKAFGIMKERMGDNLTYLSAGESIEI